MTAPDGSDGDVARLRPGADGAQAAERLRVLRLEGENLYSLGVGPPGQAAPRQRRAYLDWVGQAEDLLETLFLPNGLTAGLHTPRYLSLLEDRLPAAEIPRVVEAEVRRGLRLLEGLKVALTDAAERPEDAAADVIGSPAGVAERRVFVSHAGEDQQRFVEGLARRLTLAGVHAWYSGWDLKPGDSLVRKIFDGGIGQADAFLVVLSEHSVQKPWVQAELDAALIRQIQGTCRIIPVVLDGVAVPASLSSLIWVPIDDLDNYDPQLGRIVATIFDVEDRPSLGRPPAYLAEPAMPGLRPDEGTVFRLICEEALGGTPLVTVGPLLERAAAAGVTPGQAREALDVLTRIQHLIECKESNRGPVAARPTSDGLQTYLENVRSDLGDLRRRVAAELANDPPASLGDLAERLNEQVGLVGHLLRPLEADRLVHVAETMGPLANYRILVLSPAIGRHA